MGSVVRFARYREIAAEVAERLARGAGREALVPTGGMADAIAAEIVARVPAGIAGVRLSTLEVLAQRLLNDVGEYPRVASDAERRLAMRTAIRTIDAPLTQSRGVASMLERSYRDARDSGLTLPELESRVRNARALRNRERTLLVLRAFREYERLITALGAIDPADLFARATRFAPGAEPQLLAGFYDMTGVQRDFVDALPLEEVWIPTEEPFGTLGTLATRTESGGFATGRLRAGRHREAATWSTIREETRLEEMRATCADVQALLADGVPARAIGIVARSIDPYDARLLNRFAAELGFTTTFAEELPLIGHPIGRAIVTLLRLRERGFLLGEVLELVRDGLKTKTAINVDAADEATRRARIAGGSSESLGKLRGRNRHIDAYIDLVAELETVAAGFSPPGRDGGLKPAATEGLASLFRAESPSDLDALEAIDDIAELLRRAERAGIRVDAATVIDAIEQTSLKQRKETGVWLGDVMKFRGRTFDHLFVVRAQDDLFPQRRTEDPLFPDADRETLGIRQIGDGRDEEHLLFTLLFDGAREQVTFRFAGTDGFGKILRPSSLLRNVAIEEFPEDKQKILHDFGAWMQQPKSLQLYNSTTPQLRSLQLLAKSGTNSTFDGYIAANDRFRTALLSATPTQLEDFGECPQKFLWKHILKVRDVDDPEHELQIHHREKGIVDHRILERFYRWLVKEHPIQWLAAALPRLPDDVSSMIEALVDEEFDRLEHDAPPHSRAVRDMERRATKRILRDFIVADLADLASHDIRPQNFEYRFGERASRPPREAGGDARGPFAVDHPEPFVIEANGIPIRIDGTIDRIDAGPNAFRIVDYKSGKALRHQKLGLKVDRGVRLQLALYAMAVAEFFDVDAEHVEAAIKPLVPGEATPTSFHFKLADKATRLRETLDLFAAAIVAGRFPAFPNEKDDDFNSCKYCPVKHSCRTKHDAEEKYAVTQRKDPRTLLGAMP